MRTIYLAQALALLTLTTACDCRKPGCEDVVCETYVHRYGVPLDPDDWHCRGRDGHVVSTLKNGVTVSKTYEGGILHGETTYTFPHQEIIQKREFYEQGQLVQEVQNYPNGIPQQQIVYSSPAQRSLVGWYESGSPQCKEEYDGDLLVRGEYYNLYHQTESVVDNGNGVRIRRDGYGQLLSKDDVCDGQMTARTTYHPNGAPESITPYVNGKIEGERKTFYPGGDPNTIELWTNNCQHGYTVIFQNGERFSEMPYVRGQRHGIEKRYRDGQALVEEVSWECGQRHGPCYSYVGNDTRTDWYFEGQKVNKRVYDAMMNQR
jgi:antitoxin component YwqK of YwqJK toxin-antitoxin module